MSAWDELGSRDNSESAALQIKLDSKIQTLCDIQGRKLSDEARRHWLKELLPFAKGKAIWKALEKACNEKGMPAISWVLEQMAIDARRDTKPFVSPPEPTEDERRRADAAAIKSMLWLNYEHGHGPEHVGGIVARCMARIYEMNFGTDATAAIEAAKNQPGNDRESILEWMRHQESIGN